jgi:hypothetical protein
MATVYFRSLDDVEAIDVQFLTRAGHVRKLKLLIDSGFTGKSSFVLGENAVGLVRAEMPPAQTTGALQGAQSRAWVTCRIPGLSFQATLAAIFTDLTSLSLPKEVQGMAGLNFLRQFACWGAERAGKKWRFYLSNSQD